MANRIGIQTDTVILEESSTTEEVIAFIKDQSAYDGLLVQLPVPKHIDEQAIIHAIPLQQDADGFHPTNLGKLMIHDSTATLPCTPKGIVELLKKYTEFGDTGTLDGVHVLIIGRSNIVGKPMANLLTNLGATVTIANSKTNRIYSLMMRNHIIISAVGKPKIWNQSNYFSKGQFLIDVGMNHDENGKLCGDFDYDKLVDKVQGITPVPGGVGAMTVAMLMRNTIDLAKKKEEKNNG
jgi:methylenetetrahydrofolate dehydrogenase (NADP+)/methenyltetrahydrofolate cyclohydrolase